MIGAEPNIRRRMHESGGVGIQCREVQGCRDAGGAGLRGNKPTFRAVLFDNVCSYRCGITNISISMISIRAAGHRIDQF